MWEAIRANKRKSIILVFAMLLVMLTLGAAIGGSMGAYMAGPSQDTIFGGLFIGIMAATLLWFIMTVVSIWQGDRILLRMSGAREIEKKDHPQLFNVVEEMTIAAQLPQRPRVFVINDTAMNAFATGRTPEKSAVAITSGLLGRLNRDQLQGVIAHEIGHIKNEDIKYMTRLSIMLGTIVILSQVFLRSVFYSSASRRYSSRRSGGKGGGQAQIVFMVLAIVLAILAPILGQIILLASSRQREYLADASAVVFTRYPEGLASALELLGKDQNKLQNVSKATAPMYIINPMQARGSATGWFSTHPPLEERVRILRGIAGNASYTNYQQAWSKTSGSKAGQLPTSALAAGESHAVREASAAADSKQDARGRMREAGDMLRRMHEFMFLACACGMRIKIPPEFKHDQIACPRCKRSLEVPREQLAAAAAVGAAMGSQQGPTPGAGGIPFAASKEHPKPKADEKPQVITRRGNEWLSFKCRCGAMKHLAPSFSAPQAKCEQCGATIKVVQRDGE
ncbi:MAG: M48 family metallopeptidase [Candidatus Hydrogenedentota bacterium]